MTAGFLAYGVVILYYPGHVCKNEKHTGLYTWALVTWFLLLANILVSFYTCLYEFCGWQLCEDKIVYNKGDKIEARRHNLDEWRAAEVIRDREDGTFDIIYNDEERDTHVPAHLIRPFKVSNDAYSTEETRLVYKEEKMNSGYSSV